MPVVFNIYGLAHHSAFGLLYSVLRNPTVELEKVQPIAQILFHKTLTHNNAPQL